MMNWRRHAQHVIHETLSALPAGSGLEARRSSLEAAYPFGKRKGWPYRVWRQECRRALAWDSFPSVEWSGGEVRCGWCKDETCVVCFQLREDARV